MRMFQKVRCFFGAHHRDRRTAWDDGNTFRARCTGCGRQMIRGVDGWSVVGTGEERTRDG
jgi:hypothetical protein